MPLHFPGKQKAFFVLLIIVVVAGYLCFAGLSGAPRDFNVVLITIDALRADHLGCYGYKRDTSPNIDALAREGTLCTQAIAQSSHTPTSFGVITSSTYPPENQLRGWGDTLAPALPTLPKILKSRGWRTIFASNNIHFRGGLHGFDKGFDEFYDERAPASVLTQKVSGFFDRGGSKPFFLWVHYMDVHEYASPKEFAGLFMGDRLYNKQNKLPIVQSARGHYGRNGIPEFRAEENGWVDNPDYYVALYDGAVRYVDAQVGLLLEHLREISKRKDLLVLLTADHGELLGEHGFYFHHGAFLYEPLIKVPFILRGPDFPAGRIDTQISAGLDILPTILSALKIKKPASAQGVALMPPPTKSIAGSSYVLSDEAYTRTSVRTESWKLIRFSTEEGLSETYRLFNLKTDPGETKDLVSVERVRFEILKEKLDAYREKFAGTKPSPSTLSEETRAGLKALGYLQ